jgi:hypothetical protein
MLVLAWSISALWPIAQGGGGTRHGGRLAGAAAACLVLPCRRRGAESGHPRDEKGVGEPTPRVASYGPHQEVANNDNHPCGRASGGAELLRWMRCRRLGSVREVGWFADRKEGWGSSVGSAWLKLGPAAWLERRLPVGLGAWLWRSRAWRIDPRRLVTALNGRVALMCGAATEKSMGLAGDRGARPAGAVLRWHGEGGGPVQEEGAKLMGGPMRLGPDIKIK